MYIFMLEDMGCLTGEGGNKWFTGGQFMLIFMQVVRLLPSSLLYTQRANEV